MSPDKNVARVHRFISGCTEPMAVLRDRHGRLEILPAASLRFAALAACAEWQPRIAGVFSPDVPLAIFQRELAA